MGKSCILLPHGGYALIPTVLTTMAWVASVFQDGCDYAIIEGPIVQTITDDDDSVPWVEVGYDAYRTPEYNIEKEVWEVTYTGHCTDYDTDRGLELDPAWKGAKAFAFLALVLGGGGALFLWFSACCVFSKATWRWAGYEVLLAAVFQALAFLWFGNSMCRYHNTCSLSWGSKADIVACVFWSLAALAIFFHYPVPKSLLVQDHPMQRQRETTNPEIAIITTPSSFLNSPAATNNNNNTTVATTATKQSSSSCYEGSAQIAAALPLEGDPAATISPSSLLSSSSIRRQRVRNDQDYDGFTGGKQLKDVEVL